MPSKSLGAPAAPADASFVEEGEGRFIDPIDALPSLFVDPDGRGSRKWAHMFDPARCEELDLVQLLGDLPKL